MPEAVYLGIEIGGTKIQLGVGDGRGELTAKVRFDVDKAAGASGIRLAVENHLPDLDRQFNIKAVGVGFGGPVDAASGTAITSHQVAGWDLFPLRTWMAEWFKQHGKRREPLPVAVENDSNAAGWAEYKLGAGRGGRNMLYMNVGSGIGGCLVLGGQLYNGCGAGACEIGHTWVPVPGGGKEKLELFASGWSFQDRLRKTYPMIAGAPLTVLSGGDPCRIDGPLAVQAAGKGDGFVQAAFQEEGTVLGLALANAANLLCPEVIVVGGGLAMAGDLLLESIQTAFDRYLIDAFRGRCRIVQVLLEEDVVVHGALLMAMDMH